MEMIKSAFALSCLKALFDNNELHSGPTKQGWEIINEKYTNFK